MRLPVCLVLASLAGVSCGRSPVAGPEENEPRNPPSETAVPAYRAIDLGTLGGSWTTPYAINDSGLIVGTSERADHIGSGFLYRAGAMHELSLPRPVFPDGPLGMLAINAAGGIAAVDRDGGGLLIWDPGSLISRRIVLERYPTPPPTRVVGLNEEGDILVKLEEHYDQRAVLVQNGMGSEIGGLVTGRPWTIASAWNASGQIVGSSWVRYFNPATEIFHPFIWENGTMRDLGVLGSVKCRDDSNEDCAEGEAVDINAAGVIVGSTTSNAGFPRITVWDGAGMHEIEAFPGHPTGAIAINDRGQILGGVAGPDYGIFVWENGTVQRCGTTGGGTWARGFGEGGEVIGDLQVAGESHAFVCRDGKTIDLGPGSARAINRRGDIVGTNNSRGILWVKNTDASMVP